MIAIETTEAAPAGGLFGTSGDSSFLMYDNSRITYKGVILAMPGLNLGAYMWAPFSSPAEYEHIRALIDDGWLVLAIDGGSSTLWPSPAMMTIMDAAVTALLAHPRAVSHTKVHLLGYSRGGMSVLNYAKHFSARVASVYTVEALTDMSAAYAPAGYAPAYGLLPSHATYAPQIDASFGSTAATYAALTAGYQIMPDAAAFRGLVPIRMVHTDDDTTVQIAMTKAFITAVNDPHVVLKELATGNHGPWAQLDKTDMRTFFDSIART